MTSPDAFPDRRAQARCPVSISARIHIPLAEAGSAVLAAKAQIESLGASGARAHLSKLRKEHVALLLRSRRNCTLFFHLPGRESPLFLNGEIAWVDLHQDEHTPGARVGIQFGAMPAETSQVLHSALMTLKENACPSGFMQNSSGPSCQPAKDQ